LVATEHARNVAVDRQALSVVEHHPSTDRRKRHEKTDHNHRPDLGRAGTGCPGRMRLIRAPRADDLREPAVDDDHERGGHLSGERHRRQR
jgi:hypothetical protein